MLNMKNKQIPQKKMIRKILLYLPVVFGNFYGQWIPRISNWNTGRLYFGDNYSFGVSSYGPVCQGTKDESISGENGQRKCLKIAKIT